MFRSRKVLEFIFLYVEKETDFNGRKKDIAFRAFDRTCGSALKAGLCGVLGEDRRWEVLVFPTNIILKIEVLYTKKKHFLR